MVDKTVKDKMFMVEALRHSERGQGSVFCLECGEKFDSIIVGCLVHGRCIQQLGCEAQDFMQKARGE